MTTSPEQKPLKFTADSRAKAFKRLGLATVADLLSYYPRDYEDRTVIYKISGLEDGQTRQFLAEICEPVRVSRIRDGLTIYKTTVRDETGRASLVFFNTTYIRTTLVPGKRFLFYGKAARIGVMFELNSPEISPESETGSIVPIYPLTEGLSRKIVTNKIRSELKNTAGTLAETLPEQLLASHNLAPREFSVENIHLPQDWKSLDLARRRLVFEELFYMSLGLARLRSRRTDLPGRVFAKPDFAEFFSVLPFELTGAQKRAIEEGASDMSSGRLTNRLVQGDVGSGKTVVAAALAWMAVKNGCQAAFMAPTEILAAQHFATLSKLFAPLGVNCVLLTGSLGAAAKREARVSIATGASKIVVGTHALLSGPVEFNSLGLVVCDEQHRFGVNQRYLLAAKGDYPHTLVMSATPIPRTLGLILYGDLDLSILDEMPPGRQKIDTFRVEGDKRSRVEAFTRKQVAEGRQAYIICPLVEESDSLDVKSVARHAEDLKNRVYAGLRVEIIHGKMRPSEKDRVMSAFAAGSVDVLVSTTVVEVGVDNPNASLMIVENAERFGLSQLHQLRGRVGRGTHKSYCVLFCETQNETTAARMDVLCKTNDGFAVAEKDLELRGPGDFFGKRQHGLPGLKLASLVSDMDVLKEAQAAAAELLTLDPGLSLPEHQIVAQKLSSLFDDTTGNAFN